MYLNNTYKVRFVYYAESNQLKCQFSERKKKTLTNYIYSFFCEGSNSIGIVFIRGIQ